MNTNPKKMFSWKSVFLSCIVAGLFVAGIAVALNSWVQTTKGSSIVYPKVIAVSSAPVAFGYPVGEESDQSLSSSTGELESTSTSGGLGSSFEAPHRPVRLVIPAIKVDAVVQSVGILENGSMGIPTNFTDVAWYNKGSIPGAPGSAVIAGHLDGKNVPQAVFYNLSNLASGDLVEVIDQRGEVLRFAVVVVKTYDHNDSASEVFSSDASRVRLNLITCGGVWDKTQKIYTKRIVVFTELVGTN